jgi:hypothetical protein
MVLTNFPYDPLLDLAPWMGQRQASFRFNLWNRVSGINQGEITPLRTAVLTHNTAQTIKRQLNIALGATDTAHINPISDMVAVTMVFPGGQEYPLGQYVFTDSGYQKFTSGELSNMVLNDYMYIIDQQIEKGFACKNNVALVSLADGTGVPTCIEKLLRGYDIDLDIEPTTFTSADAWPAGAMRGSILESLALSGDYFSPYFGNDGALHFIRAFDPINRVADLDWDEGNQVLRSSIMATSNVLTAPNRFIVVSNAPSDPRTPVYGVADVPINAPHSIQNRGFVIPKVVDLQAVNTSQCQAMAQNLAQRQTVFQTMTLTTAPDPRHDSYNVIQWQGEKWLELAWRLPLQEGAEMSHTLRKAYR